jgi:hypothetical protein
MHCKDCKYRTLKPQRKALYICTNNKLSEDGGFTDEEKTDMLIYNYLEGGTFEVGELFGCIHFEKGE